MTFLKHSLILWSFLATTLVAQEPIDVTVPLMPSGDAESRGYAIVIGVDTYRDPQLDALSFAVKDAEAVAAYLKGQGAGAAAPGAVARRIAARARPTPRTTSWVSVLSWPEFHEHAIASEGRA